VLQLFGRGYSTKKTADELIISPELVDFYRETLTKKLGVSDRIALLRLATLWEDEGRLGYLRQSP
jgi:DNA-binding CsgD family transcriptional regulator